MKNGPSAVAGVARGPALRREHQPPAVGEHPGGRRRRDAEDRVDDAAAGPLADEELAPGLRSVAVPVRDGTGAVRAAMNVTVHPAENSTERLMPDHLPLLQRTAGDVSTEWALRHTRPHVELRRTADGGSAIA